MPGNLPVELSSFVGRTAELDQVHALLEQQRLVTLTGPGGIGKSRIALRAAAGAASGYPDGVWLVDLAIVRTADGVRDVANGAFGLNGIVDGLGGRKLLLVLDNCEHVLTASAAMTQSLLERAPAVHVLATSREVLGVPGEAVWPTPALSLPDECETSAERLRLSEAARLFLERVNAGVPAITLQAEEVPWVAEICRRLDGVPLALELAAGRVRTLGLRQLASLLRDPTRMLNLSSHAPGQARPLAEVEQVLLRRLLEVLRQYALERLEAIGNNELQRGRCAVQQRIAPRPVARLTPREHEVIALLARGCSNREIGAELVISEATARVHVEHILTKLALRSRTQAAVWALHRGFTARE